MIFNSALFLIQFKFIVSAVKPEDYLMKYGYLSAQSRTADDIKEAIETFQKLFKLSVTGIADQKTIELMSKRRCGVEDPVIIIKSRKIEDGFILEGSKWTNYKLTYKIVRWSKKLDQNQTLETIINAFKTWSSVTPLQFIREENLRRKVHFDILFATGMHCCHEGSPFASRFDGKGGSMAHAAYPSYGGDIHLDDDEDWSFGIDSNKPSLLHTITHEIGHALGLEHILDLDSFMFPYEFGYRNDNVLDVGTIKGVRTLYGNESIILP